MLMEREDRAESLFHQCAQASMCARVKEKEGRRIVRGREWQREAMQQWKKWNRWRKRRRWGGKRKMTKKRNKNISLVAWKKFHAQEKFCHAREVIRQRERRWRGKGERRCGGRRRGKGGGERARTSLTTRKKFPR